MSQENVEIVRRVFDNFDRREKAAWLANFAPDCKTIPPAEWPENAPILGPEAAWDFYIRNVEVFEEGSFDLREVRDVGNDRVIVNQHRVMRGRASGASVVYDFWIVVTLQRGQCVCFDWFGTEAEALETEGLSE